MNIKIDSQNGGAKYGNKTAFAPRVYCGAQLSAPKGRIIGRPNQCYNIGLKTGYVAGLKKSEDEKRKSNVMFSKAGETLGRTFQKNFVDINNLEKMPQLKLKEILGKLYRDSKGKLREKYGDPARFTKERMIPIIRAEYKQTSFGRGSCIKM